jgi:four helix bundle protein
MLYALCDIARGESRGHSALGKEAKRRFWVVNSMHYALCDIVPGREHILVKFRFQDLEIWQLSIEIGDKLFNVADELEKLHLYRFAEQLRGAGMSMSNNIAEGSGSSSDREFKQFLNIARRSTFENANILILLSKRNLIDQKPMESLLTQLDILCRKITNFQKALKQG